MNIKTITRKPREPTPQDVIFDSPSGYTLLRDMVRVVRPSARLTQTNDLDCTGRLNVFRVEIDSLYRFGYLRQPAIRSIQVDSTHPRDEFLQPYDLVMVSKGHHLGVVSLAPPDTPSSGEGGWITPKSMTILRPNSKREAIYLAVFFQSDLGFSLLVQMGGWIQERPITRVTLNRIVVPTMTEELSQLTSGVLSWQVQQQKEISRIREELHESKLKIWVSPFTSAATLKV